MWRTSAIDLSDGLLGDLGHVLQASNVGACVQTDNAIQLIANSAYLSSARGQFDSNYLLQYALAGGDDYELAFTAPPSARIQVQAAARTAETAVTRIGHIEAAPGLRVADSAGQALTTAFASFDHFADKS